MRRGNTIAGASSLMGVELATRVIGPLLTLIVVRALGPEEFGVYAAALAIINFIALLPSVGIEPAVTKWVATDMPVRDTIRVSMLIVAVLTGVGIILLVVWITARGDLDAVAITSMLMLGYIPGAGLSAIVTGACQGQSRYSASAVFTAFANAAQWIGVVAILILHLASAESVGAAQALTFFLASVIIVAIFLHGTETRSRSIRSEFRPFMRDMIGFAGTGSLFHIYNRADAVLLASLSAPIEVGAYTIAYRITEIVFSLPGLLFNKVLYAKFFRWSSTASDRVRLYVAMTSKLLALFAAVITLVIALLGPAGLILILGPDHRDAASLLRLLAWVIPFQFITAPTGALLVTQGHVRERIKGQGLALGTNLLLNVILIPRYGARGAAIAMLLSALVNYVGSVTMARRFLPHLTPSIGHHLAISTPSIAAALIAMGTEDSDLMVVLGWVALLTTALILWAAKWFTTEERDELMQLLKKRGPDAAQS